METYLGIDGGGSKTRALLVDAEGNKIHYAESGPSNLNAYGEHIIRTSLIEVVEQCIEAVGAKVSATCFGIAGASSPGAKAKIQTLIQPLGLQKVAITSDAAIALEGAFCGGPGILLIAGTGSACFGKSIEGKIYRTGGWGWLADDAGSAAWIGQRGIEAAVQQNDGRKSGSALRDRIFAKLEITSNEELNSKLYQPLLSRSKLGELAQCVLGLAITGDTEAQSIQQEALDELEKLTRVTADKLRGKVADFSFTGGLLVHNQNFRQELESRLSDFNIQEPQSKPLDGAVALARKI